MAITLFPSRGRFWPLGRLRRARLAAEPVAVALEVIDLAVVSRRSTRAAASAVSCRTRPHSVRLLFDVISVAFFSYLVAITS